MNPVANRRVVLVHGLWFGAWSMKLLARRLRKAGFEPRRFRYRSTRGSFAHHALDLAKFAAETRSPVHFVAHSLGGLLTLKTISGSGPARADRIVLLGSPLRGSEAARKALRLPGGKRLLGAAAGPLQSGHPRLPLGSEIGAICGTRNLGLGLLVGGIERPADGTVMVSETRVEGLRGHLELPVTHTGMLLSKRLSMEVIRFLEEGSFTSAP